MYASLDLLLVMESLESQKYSRALVLQFCHFSYWQRSQHPIWQLITSHPQNLLEEDGEISLSLLAHAATVHGIQKDRNYLANLYKLTNIYRKSAADATLDLGIRVSQKRHHTVRPNDPQVAILSRHFLQVLGKLQDGSWMHYPPLQPAACSQYPSRNSMIPRLENSSQPRVRLDDFRQATRTVFLDVRRLIQLQNRSCYRAGSDLSSSDSSSDSSSSDDETSSDDQPVRHLILRHQQLKTSHSCCNCWTR